MPLVLDSLPVEQPAAVGSVAQSEPPPLLPLFPPLPLFPLLPPFPPLPSDPLPPDPLPLPFEPDRKSTRLNSSHSSISYAVFCLKKKKKKKKEE